MSAFYDQASLVVVPSGYKSGKIYAQKPLTTDGQLTFTRASTATRVNASGLIETVSSGVPRLDYLNSTCPRLLLEPQRTNLVTNSENIGAANWTNLDSTDALNVTATLDPSGYYGADKLQETTANAVHVIAFQNNLMTASNTYTFSAFLKAAERNWGSVYIYDGTSSYVAYFNLATGTKGSVTSGASSTIQSYGNGWYRCSITRTFGGSSLANGGVITATADGTITYTGTTGSGIYVWGAQLEAGAYATSYIPTLSTSVTRVADAAILNNSAALPTAYPFTLFAEINYDRTLITQYPLSLIDSSTADTYINIGLGVTGNYHPSATIRTASTTLNVAGNAEIPAGKNKLAIVVTSSSIKIYANGALLNTGTNTLAFSSGMNDLLIGQLRVIADTGTRQALTNKVMVFKSALTDAQCIELTTI